MLNRPSATHPSRIFLHFHSISLRWPIYIINSVHKIKLSSLEAFVQALTFWNGLAWDFLRDSTKPFGWFSDSFTQVTKGSNAEKFVKNTAILRFASTQSRLIPAVFHIKTLSAEHAQAKCLYAARTWKFSMNWGASTHCCCLHSFIVHRFNNDIEWQHLLYRRECFTGN